MQFARDAEIVRGHFFVRRGDESSSLQFLSCGKRKACNCIRRYRKSYLSSTKGVRLEQHRGHSATWGTALRHSCITWWVLVRSTFNWLLNFFAVGIVCMVQEIFDSGYTRPWKWWNCVYITASFFGLSGNKRNKHVYILSIKERNLSNSFQISTVVKIYTINKWTTQTDSCLNLS